MKLLAIFLMALTVTTTATAEQPLNAWNPKVEFTLEKASYRETLAWLSGWSYALTEMAKTPETKDRSGPVCLPPNGIIGSKLLLESLNTKFKGQQITSEQASVVIWATAVANYACSK